MPHRDKKTITRYGPITSPVAKFPGEKRFQWQAMKSSCNASYEIPEDQVRRSISFPASVKKPSFLNADAAKNTNGPGSYDSAKGIQIHSEYLSRPQVKFALAPRQSMAIKTPSPGAVYNIGNCYYNGPETSVKVGFCMDTRKPLQAPSLTADADPVYPKLPTSTGITIGKRLEKKMKPTPSPSYDPYKNAPSSGPLFTFGKSKSDRFSKASFLPDLGDW